MDDDHIETPVIGMDNGGKTAMVPGIVLVLLLIAIIAWLLGA